MKKRIVIIALLLMACLSSCSRGTKTSSGNTSEMGLKEISEVRETCDKDLEEAKNGKYKNLKFDDISIYEGFPDEIYALEDDEGIVNTNIEDIKKELRKLEDEFYTIFEGIEDIDRKYLNIDREGRINEQYDNVMKDIEEGKCKVEDLFRVVHYDEWGNLEIESPRYFQANIYHSPMWVRKQLYADKGIPDDDTIEGEKEYYVYTSNKEFLDDTYKLLSGEEWSIKDAIVYAESLVNEKSNGLALNNKLVVDKVYARKRTNDLYDLVCRLRREKDGMLFDSQSAYSVSYSEGSMLQNYEFDTTILVITGVKEWSYYFNSSDSGELKKTGEKITKIIPVDEALKILSEGIGENSIYNIKSVEMSYLQMVEFVGDEEKRNYTPKWRIVATNNNDDTEITFFVDIQTGEIIEIEL